MVDEASVETDRNSRPPSAGGRIGELIAGKYRVIRPLGVGSTGTVHLCEHTALEKQVAVKVLHHDLTADSGLVERFQLEARTAARLDHPNSVRVTDFGQDQDGTLYLAMEYVPGRDLSELLNADWSLSDERIVYIMTGVLSALSAAHALGIVHRDLKPENILVRTVEADDDESRLREVVKVCDFGIAQLSSLPVVEGHRPRNPLRLPVSTVQTRRITGDGMVVGTCAYMSPEQARALPLDARSDLYSAGVVLYQLLTRTLPFVAETPIAVATMHCDTPPSPPSAHGPVNPVLEAVCLRALSKTPDARHQSASEMLAELQTALHSPRSRWALARTTQSVESARHMLALPTHSGQELTRLGSVAPTELSRRVEDPRRARRKRMISLTLTIATLAVPAFAAVPYITSHRAESVVPQVAGVAGVAGEQDRAVKAASALPPAVQLAEPSEPAPPIALTTVVSDLVEPTPPTAAPEAPAPRRERRVVARAHKPEVTPTPVAAPATEPAQPAAAEPSELPAEASTPEVPQVAEAAAPAVVEQPVAPVVPAPALPEPSAPAPVKPRPAVFSQLSIQLDKVPSGVSKASARSAINQSAVAHCYQEPGAQHAGSHATLAVTTNTSGRIVRAQVTGEDLPASLRACIEQVAHAGQIRDADLGEVQATFTLTRHD